MGKNIEELGIKQIKKPNLTKKENSELLPLFNFIQKICNLINTKLDNNIIPNQTIETQKGDITAILISNPEQDVPIMAKVLGSYLNTTQDLSIVEFMLKKKGISTLKLNFNEIQKIIFYGNEKEKKIIKDSKAFISGLPYRNGGEKLWKNLDKGNLKHSNANTDPKIINELYYSYQILQSINARQPKTAFITTDEIFSISDTNEEQYKSFLIKKLEDNKVIEEQKKQQNELGDKEKVLGKIFEKYNQEWIAEFEKEQLKKIIKNKIEESGLKVDKNNKIFLRTGSGSFKYMDPDETKKSAEINHLINTLRILQNQQKEKIVNKIEEKITKNKKEEEINKIIQSISNQKDIQKISNDLIKWAKIEEKIKEKVIGHSLRSGFQKINEDSVFDNIDKLTEWIIENLIHIIGNGLLTKSGIAIREYIKIDGKIEKDNSIIPFAKEYRCIINNGEIISIDFWSPLREIKKELEDKKLNIEDYSISKENINEIKRVAKCFSEKTGYQSYTLDLMINKNQEMFFHEINRLEFSHMSHQKTRMMLAYESACYLAHIEPDPEEFNFLFKELTKDFETFNSMFYENLNIFWEEFTKKNPETKTTYDMWKQIIKDEYDIIKKYDVVWGKYKTSKN